MIAVTYTLAAAALLAGVTPALAQGAAPPAPPAAKKPIFKQVVPKPTGENGYEDLVLAADALNSSRVWLQAEQRIAEGKLTLAMKRRVLEDANVLRALVLMRRAVTKPVMSPRDDLGFDTLLPEFAGFRSLGRLLHMQQYVFLADGRTSDAIANLRLALRMGQVIQTDTLISGLVGVAITAMCVTPVADHLDQLSARDCEVLHRVCLEWLAQPDPQARIIEQERRVTLKEFHRLRNKAGTDIAHTLGLDAQPAPAAGAGRAEEDAESRRLAEDLKRLDLPTPEAREAFFGDLAAQLDRFYGRILEETRKPRWERKPVPVQDDGTLPSRIAATFVPAFERVGDAYARDEARIRLLAVHALIRRYRWEHDRLPPDLKMLDVAKLALDPFTGEPLRYEPQGKTYRLYSVGPLAPADDPRAINGRRPVSVVPGEL
jgi:hypothetical protein